MGLTRKELFEQRRTEVEHEKVRRVHKTARALGRELTMEEQRREEMKIERARETMDRMNWK